MQTQPILETQSLSKSYGSLKAVESLSLKVYRNEIFGFLGPNGAGKSTSIKMMCGLLKPDQGTIHIPHSTNKSLIGICPQQNAVWENLTCLEQLIFSGQTHGLKRTEAKIRAQEMLAVFGLLDKKNSLAKTLSGGMLRRLNIALAFLHRPSLVFLDEPQAGLDPQSRILVREYILSVKKEITIVLTTHDMEEAEKLSDRICIFDHGKILAMGTPHSICSETSGFQVLEIETAEEIQKLFTALPKEIQGYWKSINSNKASFSSAVQDGWKIIFSAIEQNRLTIRQFSLRNPSLEDVFIRLTGRSLRE